jgi:hypothetical protein
MGRTIRNCRNEDQKETSKGCPAARLFEVRLMRALGLCERVASNPYVLPLNELKNVQKSKF